MFASSSMQIPVNCICTESPCFIFFTLSQWQAYRSSMLKAFKKTVEEGDFTFIIGMYLKILVA